MFLIGNFSQKPKLLCSQYCVTNIKIQLMWMYRRNIPVLQTGRMESEKSRPPGFLMLLPHYRSEHESGILTGFRIFRSVLLKFIPACFIKIHN